jgi:hypothetical protein
MRPALTEIQIRRALTRMHGSFEGFRDLSSYDALASTAVGHTAEDKAAGIQPVHVPSEADLRKILDGDRSSLDQIKGEAYRRLADVIDSATAPQEAGVPRGEVASWGTKEASARSYLAGSAAPQDEAILQSEAELTAEPLGELARRIVAKADAYRVRAGRIAGFRQKYGTQVGEAKTVDEVRAILAEAEEAAPGALDSQQTE